MKDFLEKHDTLCLIAISIIISVIITSALFAYYNNFYTEDNKIIIEVLDKNYRSHLQYNASTKTTITKYKYYLLWEEGEIKVSKSVYDDTNIGDRIIIIESIMYDKKTNEIHDISYEYGGD